MRLVSERPLGHYDVSVMSGDWLINAGDFRHWKHFFSVIIWKLDSYLNDGKLQQRRKWIDFFQGQSKQLHWNDIWWKNHRYGFSGVEEQQLKLSVDKRVHYNPLLKKTPASTSIGNFFSSMSSCNTNLSQHTCGKVIRSACQVNI